eukprot:scaffold23765_cov35-Cyclotella_meneghiniana.AAC.1
MVALCCCCNKKSKGKIDDATKVSEPLIKSAAEKSDDEDSIGSDYGSDEPLIKSAAEKLDDEDSIGSDYESQKIRVVIRSISMASG